MYIQHHGDIRVNWIERRETGDNVGTHSDPEQTNPRVASRLVVGSSELPTLLAGIVTAVRALLEKNDRN